MGNGMMSPVREQSVLSVRRGKRVIQLEPTQSLPHQVFFLQQHNLLKVQIPYMKSHNVIHVNIYHFKSWNVKMLICYSLNVSLCYAGSAKLNYFIFHYSLLCFWCCFIFVSVNYKTQSCWGLAGVFQMWRLSGRAKKCNWKQGHWKPVKTKSLQWLHMDRHKKTGTLSIKVLTSLAMELLWITISYLPIIVSEQFPLMLYKHSLNGIMASQVMLCLA